MRKRSERGEEMGDEEVKRGVVGREKRYEVGGIGGVDNRAREELTVGGMARLGRGAREEKVQSLRK